MTKVVHCKKEPYDVYIGRPRRGAILLLWVRMVREKKLYESTKSGCWSSQPY